MLQIIFLTIASVAIFLPLVGFVAQRLLYPGVSFDASRHLSASDGDWRKDWPIF